METLGWLKSGKRPKMVSCQSDGCAPIVKAFESGAHAKRVDNAATVAVACVCRKRLGIS